jgi:hypothetical protein
MKKKPPQEPETYIRVKLPLSSAFPSCPSGDTDFAEAMEAAILAAMPAGWTVVKPRANYRAPVDCDGLTLLRVARLPEGSHMSFRERLGDAKE